MNSINDITSSLSLFKMIYHNLILQKVHNIRKYAKKLHANATVLAAVGDSLLGLIVFYSNDQITKTAYIPMIAVRPDAQKNKVGTCLLSQCIEKSIQNDMHYLKLEVNRHNEAAIRFYEKNGFEYDSDASELKIFMQRKL